MDLNEIVQNRAVVSALLKKTVSTGQTGPVTRWISPHESHLNVFNYSNLNDTSSIASLVDLHKVIFSHPKYHVTSPAKHRQKLFLKFDNAELPESTPPRPTLSEVRNIVETGELFMAIYSLEGYNFSLEFSHVYGGENSLDTSFADLMAVFSRAVRAVDPTVSANLAQTYAEYILRVATWEVQIAKATCLATLEAHFPSIKARVTEKAKFNVPSIYIGTGEDMSLCFWVRLCPTIESTSDDTGDLRELDKQFEKHTSFCYYRRHPVTPELCEELDLAGFADSTSGEEEFSSAASKDKDKDIDKGGKQRHGAVLPPPKKPKQHEVFVSMLVRNTSHLDAEAQAELDEVAFSVENEFEEGISNSVMYETEAQSGVDSPRRASALVPAGSGPSKGTKTGAGAGAGSGSGRGSRGEVSGASWTSDSSPFAEIYGWGRNTAYLFDKSKERIADRSASMLTADEKKQMEGHDTNYVCFNPTAISIPPSIHLERIRMIACSPTHMLVLTHNGSLYSCGDNTEGALGLGDTKNRQSLDLVLWPSASDEEEEGEGEEGGQARQGEAAARTQREKHRHVVCVSAGAAAIGSHSMAITAAGELYGWGVAYASGHGTAKKSVTAPQKIFVPQPREVLDVLRAEAKSKREAASEAARRAGEEPQGAEGEDDEEADLTPAEQRLRDSRELEAAGSARVKHVACGGGFTVAVLECGYVAAWGMWSHGRLGLGPPPKIEGESRKARGRNKKKVVRYQLRPRLIPALKHVVKVSCGEAHTLCVTSRGRVYAWGQNSCGQVGNGPTPSGFLRDAMEPTLVSFLRDPSHSARMAMSGDSAQDRASSLQKMQVVDVCAGSFHSLATDAQQGVWSWGGRGDVCLGHNDPPISGSWAGRVSAVFSPSTNQQKILVPFELMRWCATWSRPRHIKALTVALSSEKITQLTAGDMHSGCLFSSGRFYLCGSGPVVPPIVVHKESSDEEQDDEGSEGGERDEGEVDRVVAEMSERMVTVATPRCPSAMWLPRVSSRVCKFMCSAGTYMVVVQDEDLICASLTQKLLRHTTNNPVVSLTADSVTEGSTVSASSALRTVLPPTGRGKPDCMLIVAGKVLVAHRGLLAMRCSVLREKLVEEAPVDDGMPGSIFAPTQVLLPDLVTETGRALHTFLYTGVLPPKCVRDMSMIKNLLEVGRKFRLPRLLVACDRLVKIHQAASQSLLTTSDDSDDEGDSDDDTPLLEKSRRIRVDSSRRNFIHSVFSNLSLDLPPCTLGRDLGSLVGDSQYADIRFIAEGRSLSAHRFILEARCEYFRVLFNSGLSESLDFQKRADGDPDNEVPAVVDIVVPDTFVGLLRLLIFLYTDILPDGSDGALLEDLMSADRYQVGDLKRLCESMLVPSHDNWVDLLRAATLFDSPQLEADVVSFLRDNVDDLLRVKDAGISEEFPLLLPHVMEIRRASFPLPPAQSLAAYTSQVAQVSKEKREQFHMPYWAILSALLAAFTYQHVIRVVSLGVLVPVVNVVMFMGVMYYFYYVMLNE